MSTVVKTDVVLDGENSSQLKATLIKYWRHHGD